MTSLGEFSGEVAKSSGRRNDFERTPYRNGLRGAWCAVLCACALLAAQAAAADTWWESRHGDFRIVSKLNRTETAKIARDLQVFQIALGKFFPKADIEPHQPVTLLLIDRGLWKQYLPDDSGRVGIAFPTDDHFYVLVNGDAWMKASSIVFHELTHVFLHKNYSGKALPVWLDEGYADLMSTIESGSDFVKVGLFPAWRYYSLLNAPWIPLQTVLGVAHTSPEYSSEKLAPAFYAQSWLIAHYEEFASPERRVQIHNYVTLLGDGVAQPAAFAQAFPGDSGEFEEELRQYSRRESFRYLKFTVPDLGKSIESTVTQLPEARAEEALGDWMLRHLDLNDTVMRFLERQAQAAAANSVAELQLAAAYARKNQPDRAQARLDAGCPLSTTSFAAAMLCGDAYNSMAGTVPSDATEDLMLKARRYYLDALRLEAKNPGAMIRGAYTYRRLSGDADMLIAALEQALVRDRYNPTLAASMATVLQHTDLPRTKQYLERAIVNVREREQEKYMFRWLDSVEQQIAAKQLADKQNADQAAIDAAPREVQEALARERSGDFPQADKLFAKIIAAPTFAQLKPAVQHEVLMRAGAVALRLGDARRSSSLLLRSSVMAEVSAEDWYWLFQSAYQKRDFPEARRALLRLARTAPTTLRSISDAAMVDVARATRTTDDWPQFAQALFDAKWQLANKREPEWMWSSLALLLAERGLPTRAIEVSKRIVSASGLTSLAADKRFDAVIAANPGHFDIPKALDADLERLRKTSQEDPQSLAAVAALMYSLNRQQRYDDALLLAAPIVTMPPAARTKAFRDADDYMNWIMNYRSTALAGQERWEEAAAAMKLASMQSERGRNNVSQVINLATLYLQLERHKDALDQLARVGPASGFGRMQIESIKYLAARGMQDARAAANALNYMREHKDDALDSYQQMLVTADLPDEAAKLLIERLRDPVRRSDALLLVQDYADAPARPNEIADREKWRRFLRRDDVRAAVLEFGHILKLPFRNL